MSYNNSNRRKPSSGRGREYGYYDPETGRRSASGNSSYRNSSSRTDSPARRPAPSRRSSDYYPDEQVALTKYARNGDRYRKRGQKRPLTKKEKQKRIIIALTAVIAAVVLVIGGMVWWAYDTFGGLQTSSLNHSNLGIESDLTEQTGIVNIALFGVDGSSKSKSAQRRSDTIKIVSVNLGTGDIKIASILRDTYVPIDGHSSQKITHAYFYGGPELAIKTLNKNFGLDIKDYVTVNFAQATDIIDAVGGLDIVVTRAERNNMNDMDYGYLRKHNMTLEKYSEDGKTPVHLNGAQAMRYARIRQIDSDNKRAERQDIVINKLIAKVKKQGITTKLIKSMFKLITTSYNYSRLLQFLPVAKGDLNIESCVFPSTEQYVKDKDGNSVKNKYYQYTYGGIYEGAWVWLYDLKLTSRFVHNFLYGTDKDNGGDDLNNLDTSWRYYPRSGGNSSKTTTSSKKTTSSKVRSDSSANSESITSSGDESTTSTEEPSSSETSSTESVTSSETTTSTSSGEE